MMHVIIKLLVASLGIAAIVSVASEAIFPGLPFLLVITVSAGAMLAFTGVVLLYSRIVIAWRACCLRRRAIDPAWLWFPDDPPGVHRENTRRNTKGDKSRERPIENRAED